MISRCVLFKIYSRILFDGGVAVNYLLKVDGRIGSRNEGLDGLSRGAGAVLEVDDGLLGEIVVGLLGSRHFLYANININKGRKI